LAQRSLSMIAKNCGGAVPDWRGAEPAAADLAILARADALVGLARQHMKSFGLHLYLAAVFEVVAETNRYFAAAEPWKLAKTDPARMRLTLYATIEVLRIAAVLLQPAAPSAMAALLDLLGVAPANRDFAAIDAGAAAGRFDAPRRLEPGAPLPPPKPVFPRYVEPETAMK
jgi:methionyl-tRNA synthetase